MHVTSAFLDNFLSLYYRCNINHRLLRFDDMKNEGMTFAILNFFITFIFYHSWLYFNVSNLQILVRIIKEISQLLKCTQIRKQFALNFIKCFFILLMYFIIPTDVDFRTRKVSTFSPTITLKAFSQLDALYISMFPIAFENWI